MLSGGGTGQDESLKFLLPGQEIYWETINYKLFLFFFVR